MANPNWGTDPVGPNDPRRGGNRHIREQNDLQKRLGLLRGGGSPVGPGAGTPRPSGGVRPPNYRYPDPFPSPPGGSPPIGNANANGGAQPPVPGGGPPPDYVPPSGVVKPPVAGPGTPYDPTRPNALTLQPWEQYAAENYRPGVSALQLRNQWIAQSKNLPPLSRVMSHGGQVRRYADGGAVSMAPGQALQQIRMGLRPSTYNQMLPSYKDATASIVSSLGMPPEDFWKQLEAGYPQGANPNQGITAGFAGGGKISFKHGADGSVNFTRG